MGHALTTVLLHSIDDTITHFDPEVVYAFLSLENLHLSCKDIIKLHSNGYYNQTGNYFVTYMQFCEMFKIDGGDKHKVVLSRIFFNAIRSRDLILDKDGYNNRKQNENQYASVFVLLLSLIILSTSNTFADKCKATFDLFKFDKRYIYITSASLNIMIATIVQTISALVYQQVDKLLLPLDEIKKDVEHLVTKKLLYLGKFAYHEFVEHVVGGCPENITRILQMSPFISTNDRIELQQKLQKNSTPWKNISIRTYDTPVGMDM
jgi:hypothetical protein